MSNRPDQSTLISYLYGELDEQENNKVKAYLEENLEVLKEFEALQNTRSLLSHLEDVPVNQPFILNTDHSGFTRQKNPQVFWQRWSGVAAALLVILISVVVWQLNFEIENNELRIGFQDQKTPPAIENDPVYSIQNLQDQEEYLKMLVAEVLKEKQENELLEMQDWKSNIHNEVNALKISISQQKSIQLAQKPIPNQEMTELINQIREDNYTAMIKLLEYSNEQQKVYAQEMLTNFNDYLEGKRKKDLEVIEYAINNLKSRTDLKQEETEIMITKLITQLNEER
ncbi:MAG: hypothetical protein KTR26_17065 [Flammeovirgaceae bacterium]|nr:hypothetical protein [Flammeovirgaceae bacterium]